LVVADTCAAATVPSGIPAGSLEEVLAILRAGPTPIRRRKLLEELEHRGRRISLAGLNRILDHTLRARLTAETPDGIRLAGTMP